MTIGERWIPARKLEEGLRLFLSASYRKEMPCPSLSLSGTCCWGTPRVCLYSGPKLLIEL